MAEAVQDLAEPDAGAGQVPPGQESQGPWAREVWLQPSVEDCRICTDDSEGKRGISDEWPPVWGSRELDT